MAWKECGRAFARDHHATSRMGHPGGTPDASHQGDPELYISIPASPCMPRTSEISPP